MVAQGYFQGFPVVAAALADFARHGYIGQELHFNLNVALALAGFAASAFDIEGEPARFVAPDARLRQRGEQLPYGREGAGVGGRVAARRPSDGRLVDIDYFVNVLNAGDFLVFAGAVAALRHGLRQPLVQNVIHQRAFAAAGNAGNASQQPQGKLHINALEVVLPRPLDDDGLAVAWTPLRRRRDALASAEISAGQRVFVGHHLAQAAAGDYFPAVFAGAGPEVNDVVRGPHHRIVVLHHDDGVAHIPQPGQRANQPMVVMGMQSDGGFVADIEDAGQPAADLRRQPHPLRLAAGKGARRAVHRHIVQPNAVQKVQPALNFFEYLVGDGHFAGREGNGGGRRRLGGGFAAIAPAAASFAVGVGGAGVSVAKYVVKDGRSGGMAVAIGGVVSVAIGTAGDSCAGRLDGADPLQAAPDGQAGNFHNVPSADQHAQRFGAQPRAAAGSAGTLGHIPLNFAAGMVRFGAVVAALQVGDDAFVGGLPGVSAPASGAMPHRYLLLAASVQDNVHLFIGQFPDGSMGRKVELAGDRFHHTSVPGVGRPGTRPGDDGALEQGQTPVLYHQPRVNLQLVAQARAGDAGPVRAVEAESARLYFGQADAAADAGKLLAEYQIILTLTAYRQHAIALAQGGFYRLGNAARFGVAANNQAVNHDVNVMPLLLVQRQGVGVLNRHHRAVDADADEPAAPRRLKHLPVFPFLAAHFGRQQGNARGLRQGQDGIHNLLYGLSGHRVAAFGAVRLAHPGEQQPQIVVNLRNGANGGTRVVGDPLLVNGDGRRQPLNVVHVGLVHPPQKLARVGRQRLHIAALPLGINGVKGQAALAGTGDAGNHHQPVAGDGYINVLEIVLTGAFDVNDFLRHKAVLPGAGG